MCLYLSSSWESWKQVHWGLLLCGISIPGKMKPKNRGDFSNFCWEAFLFLLFPFLFSLILFSFYGVFSSIA